MPGCPPGAIDGGLGHAEIDAFLDLDVAAVVVDLDLLGPASVGVDRVGGELGVVYPEWAAVLATTGRWDLAAGFQPLPPCLLLPFPDDPSLVPGVFVEPLLHELLGDQLLIDGVPDRGGEFLPARATGGRICLYSSKLARSQLADLASFLQKGTP